MSKLLVLVGVVLGALTLGNAVAHASPVGGARRKVTGKSGHVWFVGALPAPSPGEVSFSVFDSAKETDPVLHYTQDLKSGARTVTFRAPTSLADLAEHDFI